MIIIFGKPTEIFDPGTMQITRTAHIWISDGTTAYVANIEHLPLTGNLQPILNAQEGDIWAQMLIEGTLATSAENEIAAAIQWYIANNGAKVAVFDKSAAQSVTDVTNLVASITGLNAAQRTGLVQLLLSSLWDTRVNARERGLV